MRCYRLKHCVSSIFTDFLEKKIGQDELNKRIVRAENCDFMFGTGGDWLALTILLLVYLTLHPQTSFEINQVENIIKIQKT